MHVQNQNYRQFIQKSYYKHYVHVLITPLATLLSCMLVCSYAVGHS